MLKAGMQRSPLHMFICSQLKRIVARETDVPVATVHFWRAERTESNERHSGCWYPARRLLSNSQWLL